MTEIFSWLLEVANDTKEHQDSGRIIWSVSYVHDGPKLRDMPAEDTGQDEHRKRLIAKVEIQKDDIQAVLPIAKVSSKHGDKLGGKLCHKRLIKKNSFFFCCCSFCTNSSLFF